MTDVTTERLLGKIISQLEALEKRMDRNDQLAKDRQDKRDMQINTLQRDVDDLKGYMTETKGGRRMLVVLLTVSATLGGFIWNIIQRLLPSP